MARACYDHADSGTLSIVPVYSTSTAIQDTGRLTRYLISSLTTVFPQISSSEAILAPRPKAAPMSMVRRVMNDSSALAIEAHNLSVRRGGRDVVHGVTFGLTAGRITGLIGPSG